MIVFCSYIVSFSPPSSGGFRILMWGSLTETYSYSLVTSCFPVWSSIDILSNSLAIGYCTTFGLCKTQLYKSLFALALVFTLPFLLSRLYHKELYVLFDLCSILAAPNMHKEVLVLCPRVTKIDLAKFFYLDF